VAFRFKREGSFVKRRIHLDESGMRPWNEDFKFRVQNYQYRYWMMPQAHKALLSYQDGAAILKGHLETEASSSAATSKFSTPTRTLFFKTAIPQSVPNLITSNPFCRISSNKTGWETYRTPIVPELRCARKQVAGTDVVPPIFPKYR